MKEDIFTAQELEALQFDRSFVNAEQSGDVAFHYYSKHTLGVDLITNGIAEDEKEEYLVFFLDSDVNLPKQLVEQLCNYENNGENTTKA